MPKSSVAGGAWRALLAIAKARKFFVASTLGLLLVIALAGCSRYIDHELSNEYDSKDSIGGTFQESVGSSTPAPYEGSKVAHISVNQDPQSPAKVRGSLTLNPANSYGYYGGAFYFPPGTLNGPNPKQQLDLDVARWDYGNESEFGGVRIGVDHQARLIRGQSGQSVSMIGSPFAFQEGCWNWVVVYQRLTSDSAQRINRVYLNGQEVVTADSDVNFFGHSAEKARFGAVSTGTGTQSAFDFFIDKTFISNDSPAPPPTSNACDPVLGGADPSTISTSAQTPVADATSFLYTGDFPIQHGVSAGTISEKRGAVIEGTVNERVSPSSEDVRHLEAVRVSVVGHPEFGYTETHADGKYHMAVNGGGDLRVRFEHEDYLPVEREITVPWQDYAAADDVVMTHLDTNQTSIDLSAQNNADFQVAQGSSITDPGGTRQATLLFQKDTSATMKLADGSSQSIASPVVRATEFTVDNSLDDPEKSNGMEAMPADLPATSAFTYAVGFTVNQAVDSGATSVEFAGHKVISYTDDFLGMPTGEKVPVGYYDPAKGGWVPSESGRVIKILNNDGNIAHVSIASDDHEASASDLAAPDLQITDAERQKLAQIYPNIPSSGKKLWRMRVDHFSDYDANWGFGFPPGVRGPLGAAEFPGRLEKNCKGRGSIIECEDQVLGEHEDITGSKFGLSYRSDRGRARFSNYEITIPLTDDNPPSTLKRVDVEIDVAGQHITESFPLPTDPEARKNMKHTFRWDGKDAFGRLLQGSQPVKIAVGYTYDGNYASTAIFGAPGGASISGSRTRRELTIWNRQTGRVGGWDATSEGLGGWTLDVHHVYDPNSQTLYLGDGSQRTAQSVSRVVDRIAGGGGSNRNDGAPAKDADISGLLSVAAAPDGGYYISDFYHDRVRRVAPDGTIRTVAGSFDWDSAWHDGGFGGDGGPATSALINGPQGLDVGSDGSLYITDKLNYRIRRVSPDGVIDTVAGGGSGGDGGPATQAALGEPLDVAVAPDGTLYISDYQALRKVDPGGTITTAYVSDQAQHGIYGIDAAPDGSVYMVDGPQIKRLGPDGKVKKLAGGAYGDSGDGDALQALISPLDVLAQADGSFYMTESHHKIKFVSADGMLTTVAGSGQSFGEVDGPSPDGTPARKAVIDQPYGLAAGADGALLVADLGRNRVLSIHSPLPEFSGDDIAIPSEDGSELYQFDKQGRHLRTLNALTGATLYSFTYDNTTGRVIEVKDGEQSQNHTYINPQGSGTPTAIVGPFGQTTALSFQNGLLKDITNPDNEKTQFGYAPNATCSEAESPTGLLTSVTDPRNNKAEYCYDKHGLLTRADDRANGYQTLNRTSVPGGYETVRQTRLGRKLTYTVTRAANGDIGRSFTDPVGPGSLDDISQDGTSTDTAPDGTRTTVKRAPDPRFGIDAPTLESLKVETPAPNGETMQVQGSRQVTLQNQSDPLSIQSQTDTRVVNGRTYTTTYTASSRRFTAATPQGRQSSMDIDAQGRVAQQQISGIQPLNIGYDSSGRLQDETIQDPTLGTRNWHYTYKQSGANAGLLDAVTDPLSRVTSYGYDAAGRLTTETLPGNRLITYMYDDNGNITSITPPSRPAHSFSFSPVDLRQSYDPPSLGGSSSWGTTFDYNDDHDLVRITRPDGTANGAPVEFHYVPQTERLASFGPPVPAGDPSQDTTLTYSPQTATVSSITTADNEQLQFGYDGALPKRETYTGTISASASRAYDSDLRLASSSVNDGQTVNYSYDGDSLLTGAGDLTLSPDTANGLLRTTSMASGTSNHVTTALTYNPFGDLATQSAAYGGTPLFGEQITQRDALGRIRQKTETTPQGTHTYTYSYEPTTGFLDTVDKDGNQIADYGYDGNGNRLTKTAGTVTLNGTPDNQDRLQSYGPNSYTYTQAGDLKTKDDGSQQTTYAHDAFGTLQRVTLDANGNSPTTIAYVRDGFGRRIAKKVNGSLVQGFVYGAEAAGPVAELDNQGNVKSRFVYGTRANVPDYMVRGGNTYRIITDHLGSPRVVVDTGTGQIAQELDYDEFGNVIRDTSPGFQPFGFTGGLYDLDTKLVRMGARDYDPEAGRWTTKDPILFSGGAANLFGYTFDDPVNLIDPSGLATAGICVGGALGIGAVIGGQGCIQVSSSGEVGVSGTVGGGATAGGTATVGIGPQASNAEHISELGGPFVNATVSDAAGGGLTGHGFAGATDCNRTIVGGGFTVDAGVGSYGTVTVTETKTASISVPGLIKGAVSTLNPFD